MFKVDASNLIEYLEVVQSKGSDAEVLKVALDISKDGCQVLAGNETGSASDSSPVFIVKAQLKPTGFSSLPEANEVYNINNLGEFIKILGSVSGIVAVERQNNFIVITDNKGKTVYYILTADEYIPKPRVPTKITWTESFLAPSEIFKAAIKDASVIDSKVYCIEVKNELCEVTCGEKQSTHITKRFAAKFKDARAVFISGFDSIFSNIPGQTIRLYLLNEAPLKVESETGNMKVEYILAPASS